MIANAASTEDHELDAFGPNRECFAIKNDRKAGINRVPSGAIVCSSAWCNSVFVFAIRNDRKAGNLIASVWSLLKSEESARLGNVLRTKMIAKPASTEDHLAQ